MTLTTPRSAETGLQRLALVDAIDGWLSLPAGLLTLHLATAQDALGIDGPMLEIGVHKGKFLALMRSMTKQKIVGVQLCDLKHARKVAAEITINITKVNGYADPIEFIMADSLTIQPDDLLNKLGDRPRLIHIDGSHLADWVFHDMTISSRILREGGLMIIDDAYNHSIPDVTEGIYRFLSQPGDFVRPFAHCYNKLFATTPSHHERYLNSAKAWLLDGAPADVRDRTIARVSADTAAGYTPKVFGSEIAIFM